MTAESEKLRDTFGDQLASFDSRLEASADDVDMLTDIQQGISSLLASNGGNETEIRRVLEERYKSGSLRTETFQLVKSMLDRLEGESDTAVPSAARLEPAPFADSAANLDDTDLTSGDDVFGTTTVISNDVQSVETADSRVQVGSVLRDRFLLQEKISGGSMGVVYKALDRRLAEAEADQPFVAIKVLSPQLAENGQALRALQQEAAKGRCLLHPNVVRFIDLDRDDDLYFLVMEWLEGRTLASILDSVDARSIDHDAAFRIVGQIGDALAYAHRCGIVHADVKPGNIMVMPNGDAKLFDFGVARVRQKQADGEFDPGVLGAVTPAYSSMQVLTGDEPVAADDVFSLGCLLYRLVAGHRVFGPRNAAEAAQEGMKPQRPQGLGDGQWRALKKALSYARVTRFASIDEFMTALQANSNDTIALDESGTFEAQEAGGKGKRVALVVLLLGLLGGVSYQYGLLDPLLDRIGTQIRNLEDRVQLESVPPATDRVSEPGTDETTSEPVVEESIEPQAPPIDPEPVPEPLVDFSLLPPADVEIPFAIGRVAASNFRVKLREDDAPVIVDFVRTEGINLPLSLKLDEIGFSGNRSPWAARQFALSNDGMIRLPAGQARGRTVLTMTSDPLREADQISTLRLRELDSSNSELAVIYVTLEDDDQRAFEAQLPANTIAFAASQASVRETDPAVQINIVRFNPDDARSEIAYTVNDITATESEDYFAPGNRSITFGPGQRSARVLIPLVQDSLLEGDEAFVLELDNSSQISTNDVYQRIVVLIRDDEPQAP